VFSLAYLVQDLINSTIVFGHNNETLAHHTIGFISIPAALWIGQMVGVLNEAFLVTEISTIFLDIMFIMKILKLEEGHPKIRACNSLLLMLSFILSRIVYIGCLVIFCMIPTSINFDFDEEYELLGLAKIIVMIS